MVSRSAVWMDGLRLSLHDDERPLGTRVLDGLSAMAERAVAGLNRDASGRQTVALVSRLRGTGRGASSTRLFAEMERAHPVVLRSPFEGSDRVSGAVWNVGEILGNGRTCAVAKLRWEAGADDLPMHVHDHSDRFIIVASGRGYFHVSDEPFDEFTSEGVRTVPARERDVFLFSRGVMHTFSTDSEPMVLLSCQLPFLPFDDPRQYRLPVHRWTAAEHREDGPATIGCDAAWTVLGGW